MSPARRAKGASPKAGPSAKTRATKPATTSARKRSGSTRKTKTKSSPARSSSTRSTRKPAIQRAPSVTRPVAQQSRRAASRPVSIAPAKSSVSVLSSEETQPEETYVPFGEIAARTVDAVKIYGEGGAAVRALDGISLAIESGRFTAIMGPSGSGKSTLLHCLAGLDTLTSGKVFIGEVDLGSLKDKALTLLRREKVGFIFQSFNLVPTLSAEENITLPDGLAGKTPDRAWLDQVIKSLGLGDRLRHLPSQLSGGQQQRVAAARAIVSKPAIIFADEPTGNLDSRSGEELLRFLTEAVRALRQTIVMVTHDPFAAAHADRVVFLADGRVVGDIGSPTQERVIDMIRELSA